MRHIHTISRSMPAPGFSLGPFNPVGIAIFGLQLIAQLYLDYIKGIQKNSQSLEIPGG